MALQEILSEWRTEVEGDGVGVGWRGRGRVGGRTHNHVIYLFDSA